MGRLTGHATLELVLEGKAEWVQQELFDKKILGQSASYESKPFIIVDGCPKKCRQKRLEKESWSAEFHLVLSDIGIKNA